MRFHDPEVDRILAAAVAARERAKRAAAVRQLATALDVPAELLEHDLNYWGQLEEATEQARQQLADALRTWGPTSDRAAVENPACPCWSGFHDQHQSVCGCPTCEPEEGSDG